MIEVKPSYNAIHSRLERERGKPREHECFYCDKQAQEWAWTKECDDPIEWQKKGRKALLVYCEHINEHYIPLCKSCHAVYDEMWNHLPDTTKLTIEQVNEIRKLLPYES